MSKKNRLRLLRNKGNYFDQISENMRFYGDMRFKQLTILIAFISIAVAGLTLEGSIILFDDFRIESLIALGSILFTGVLWVMEIRSTLSWVAHREVIPRAWPRPDAKIKFINATNAVFLLHYIIYSFWLYYYAKINGINGLFCGLFVVGFFLLFYSVLNYWKLWFHRPKWTEKRKFRSAKKIKTKKTTS